MVGVVRVAFDHERFVRLPDDHLLGPLLVVLRASRPGLADGHLAIESEALAGSALSRPPLAFCIVVQHAAALEKSGMVFPIIAGVTLGHGPNSFAVGWCARP